MGKKELKMMNSHLLTSPVDNVNPQNTTYDFFDCVNKRF